jgi:hypothetical protein
MDITWWRDPVIIFLGAFSVQGLPHGFYLE